MTSEKHAVLHQQLTSAITITSPEDMGNLRHQIQKNSEDVWRN